MNKWVVVHRNRVITSRVVEAAGPEEAVALVNDDFPVDEERRHVEVFPVGAGRAFEVWREIERREDVWERSYTQRVRVAPAQTEDESS